MENPSPGLDAPAWFTRAVAVAYTERVIDVGGLRVHYVRWERRHRPALVLIHGGGAHAFWWGFLAPLLDYDVVALDLTGHGDSGRRDRYPREAWAEDVLGVIDAAGFGAKPYLVGHSMGGFVSLVVAALHGERIAGAVLVDSPVLPPTDAPGQPPQEGAQPERAAWSFDRIRPYPDLESAVQRFRLLPDQPVAHPVLVDYVARRSVREDADGFTWKFDPRVFERASRTHLRDYLASVGCRLALIRGEESVVLPRPVADYMVGLPRVAMPLVEIPCAHHHVMFDQPLALAVALRAILAGWECSAAEPRRPAS